MAWIESHQTLSHHPKTLRLAALLKCGVPAAIGYVHLLWYWALDYAQDGEIDGAMRDQVAQACLWRGKPEVFWTSLLQAGFIEPGDTGVKIHDWMDYAGRLLDKRAQHAARNKRARDTHRARSGAATGPAPGAPGGAHEARSTVPNRTGPNRTVPDLPPIAPPDDTTHEARTNGDDDPCCVMFGLTQHVHSASCSARVTA
jgi:hypothetical protein